jgi:hypothetical protein
MDIKESFVGMILSQTAHYRGNAFAIERGALVNGTSLIAIKDIVVPQRALAWRRAISNSAYR